MAWLASPVTLPVWALLGMLAICALSALAATLAVACVFWLRAFAIRAQQGRERALDIVETQQGTIKRLREPSRN